MTEEQKPAMRIHSRDELSGETIVGDGRNYYVVPLGQHEYGILGEMLKYPRRGRSPWTYVRSKKGFRKLEPGTELP